MRVNGRRESGLTALTLSIDTIDDATFRNLHGGTSLRKVLSRAIG